MLVVPEIFAKIQNNSPFGEGCRHCRLPAASLPRPQLLR
jgi:hypothetical protein